MIFAKRITSLGVKSIFAERIPPKTGTPIELFPLTKLSRNCTRKLEQACLTNRPANHQTNTAFEICMTWRSQFANRAIPLSIEHFWERATSDPPIRWEKWRIQVKLAILAGENITPNALLKTKPTQVRLPPESKFDMAIEDATEHTERDRQIHIK